MHFAIAVAIAIHFWTVRHVPINCTPTPVVATDVQVDGAMAEAYGPGQSLCGTILISRTLQHARTGNPGLYCAVIVHEVGHVGGLDHSLTGVMSAGGFRLRSSYPWDCRKVTRATSQE